MLSRRVLARVQRLYRRATMPLLRVNQEAIIILGNQKSGTSAIAHLLADYAGLSKTVDIPEFWWPTLEKLLRRQLSFQQFVEVNRHRFTTGVIKEPGLTFFYKDVRSVFPEAKILFVIRDPRDNIRSMLNRMNLPGDQDLVNIELAQAPGLWTPVFYSDVWGIPYEHYIEILAGRWVMAASIYVDNKSDMFYIRYEDFVNDKVALIASLAAQLGLQQQRDIKNRVNIQYQPAGNRNIGWREFYGKTNLRRIEAICGSLMEEFDYHTSSGD